MKQDPKIAYRYAKAFYACWGEKLSPRDIYSVISELQALSKNIFSDKQIKLFWESTSFQMAEKQNLIKVLKTKKVKQESLDFLSFLIQKKRPEIFQDIISALKDIYDRETKTLNISVTSAFELSPTDKQEMQASVSNLKVAQGHHCVFTFRVDSRVLGGIQLKIDRYIYDCSLKSSFEQLRKKIERVDVRTWMGNASSALSN